MCGVWCVVQSVGFRHRHPPTCAACTYRNLSIYLSIYLSTFLPTYLCIVIYPSFFLSISLSPYLPFYLSLYISIHTYIHVCIYIYLSPTQLCSIHVQEFRFTAAQHRPRVGPPPPHPLAPSLSAPGSCPGRGSCLRNIVEGHVEIPRLAQQMSPLQAQTPGPISCAAACGRGGCSVAV